MELEKYKGLTIRYEQDQDAESPEDFECPENGVWLITTRNRYFEVIPKGHSLDEVVEANGKGELYEDKFKIYPLYAYAHSGVVLSLGAFGCPWDSGQIGFVLIDADPSIIPDPDKAAECLVETWNQYLSGDVWGYIIEDSEGNDLDSCWGHYGEEWCREAAHQAADCIAESLACDFQI